MRKRMKVKVLLIGAAVLLVSGAARVGRDLTAGTKRRM